MTNKQRVKSLGAAVLVFCLFVFGVLSGRQMLSAFAEEEKTYTNVLADLRKDGTFSTNDYPEITDTKDKQYGSIQVIQIAESTAKKLYLYTYQPSNTVKAVVATEINMSLSQIADGTDLFPLRLLNTNGVFCKYLVSGIIVSSDLTRYYNITSIFRKWDTTIDGETDSTAAKAFRVGKLFSAETDGDTVRYSATEKTVIEVKNPYVGFLEYSDGYNIWDFLTQSTRNTDIHFIAFDTDMRIDDLQQADISYYTISYELEFYKKTWSFGERSSLQKKTILSTDSYSGKNYAWDCIKRSADFIQTVEANKGDKLTEEALTAVKKAKWVLIFLETPFTTQKKTSVAGDRVYYRGTKTEEVTVLRLEFDTDGKHYNLGAVSDKVDGGFDPSNENATKNAWDAFFQWLEDITGVPAWVWKIIICALPFVILLPILSAVFPVVGQVLSAVLKSIGVVFVWLCKGLWWLICLPFKGIAALVNKIKERRTT